MRSSLVTPWFFLFSYVLEASSLGCTDFTLHICAHRIKAPLLCWPEFSSCDSSEDSFWAGGAHWYHKASLTSFTYFSIRSVSASKAASFQVSILSLLVTKLRVWSWAPGWEQRLIENMLAGRAELVACLMLFWWRFKILTPPMAFLFAPILTLPTRTYIFVMYFSTLMVLAIVWTLNALVLKCRWMGSSFTRFILGKFVSPCTGTGSSMIILEQMWEGMMSLSYQLRGVLVC